MSFFEFIGILIGIVGFSYLLKYMKKNYPNSKLGKWIFGSWWKAKNWKEVYFKK